MDAMSLNLQSTMKEVEVKEEPIENCQERGKPIHFKCNVKEEHEDTQVDFEATWNTQDLKEECSSFEFAEHQEFNNDDEEVKPPLTVFLQPNEDKDNGETIFEKDPLASDSDTMEGMVVPGNCRFEDVQLATSRQQQFTPVGSAGSVGVLENSGCTSPSVTPRSDHPKRMPTGEKTFKCDTCKVGFFKKEQLIRHVRRHMEWRCFNCDMCQIAFSDASELSRHKRSHVGEKPYKCEVCLAAFSQPSKLSCHKRSHTGEKPFKCDVCQSAFFQSSHLLYHKRTHTGEKPLKCDMCRAAFSDPSQLSKHKRKHTGEKPFKCDVCQSGFYQSSHLSKHKRTHTGEKAIRGRRKSGCSLTAHQPFVS